MHSARGPDLETSTAPSRTCAPPPRARDTPGETNASHPGTRVRTAWRSPGRSEARMLRHGCRLPMSARTIMPSYGFRCPESSFIRMFSRIL